MSIVRLRKIYLNKDFKPLVENLIRKESDESFKGFIIDKVAITLGVLFLILSGVMIFILNIFLVIFMVFFGYFIFKTIYLSERKKVRSRKDLLDEYKINVKKTLKENLDLYAINDVSFFDLDFKTIQIEKSIVLSNVAKSYIKNKRFLFLEFYEKDIDLHKKIYLPNSSTEDILEEKISLDDINKEIFENIGNIFNNKKFNFEVFRNIYKENNVTLLFIFDIEFSDKDKEQFAQKFIHDIEYLMDKDKEYEIEDNFVFTRDIIEVSKEVNISYENVFLENGINNIYQQVKKEQQLLIKMKSINN